MLPVDPNHRENRRTDGYDDYAALKASGHVRDKTGRVIPIDKPHTNWSALDRDRLYQAYCEFAKTDPGDEAIRRWLEREAGKLKMSPTRATNIINEGNGQYPKDNMMWWRGVSV